jgi:hypothetical protein
MKDDPAQILGQAVVVIDLDWAAGRLSELARRVKTVAKFPIRMDVGIEEKSVYLVPLFPEAAEGIDGTGATADMEQNTHHRTLKC